MKRFKPEKIQGIRIRGIVTEIEKNKWFSFDIQPKNRDFREELKEIRPRFQKVENGKDKYFKPPFIRGAHVHLIYLNWESAKGLYKNPEDNLPYEILDVTGSSIYRKSITEKKENFFNRLEKSAIEKGLRNTD